MMNHEGKYLQADKNDKDTTVRQVPVLRANTIRALHQLSENNCIAVEAST